MSAKLKWRKVNCRSSMPEHRAGPFTVWQRAGDMQWDTRIDTGSNEWPRVVCLCGTERTAKAACQRLANKIIAATKGPRNAK